MNYRGMMFKIKDKIQKRISPIPLMLYDIRKNWRGARKKKYVKGVPVDMNGADHLHIYMTLKCNLNCYFCINKIVSEGEYPKFEKHHWMEWRRFLNRLYNVNELYFNGGEHFLIEGFADLINSLNNFNILIFTNLPEKGMDEIRRLKKGSNNIILKMSYHPLSRDPINQYIDRCKQIPKGILWTPHIIAAEGVSTRMYIDRFRRHGIYATADELVYNKNMMNLLTKAVECLTREHIIGPDMKMYRCLVHLIKGIRGTDIESYSFKHDWIECDWFPRCNTCSAYNDIRPKQKESMEGWVD